MCKTNSSRPINIPYPYPYVMEHNGILWYGTPHHGIQLHFEFAMVYHDISGYCTIIYNEKTIVQYDALIVIHLL